MRLVGLVLVAVKRCVLSKSMSPAPCPLLLLLLLLAATLLSAACWDRDEACRPLGPSPAAQSLRLRVVGSDLVDAAGRKVILRGVNTGGRSKFSPFFPFNFAESGAPGASSAPPFERAAAAYFDKVVEWGHNVVRLPFSWEAVEPARGAYDEVYLARYARMAELCGERGLRVVVDFHQDIFASPYCGDGFPLWTLPTPIPTRPADCRSWFTGYFSPAGPVAAAFDRFWGDADGLQSAFRAMWRHVAERLWRVDAVIGFEIINEPGMGSAAEAPWSTEVLAPFYDTVARAIREVAPGAPIFFDATALSGMSTKTLLPAPTAEAFVFAPHYYSAGVFLGGANPPDPEEIANALGEWARRRDTWKVPVLVGEFGAPSSATDAALTIRYSFDGLDRHSLHGALWEYSATADDWNAEGMSIAGEGGVEKSVAAEAIRVFPRAIAGDLVSFTCDPQRRTAKLVYRATAGATSELAAPRRLYPEGPLVRTAGASACAATASGIVQVVAAEAGELTVELSR